jgi:methionyl-tRNA formyltransferase
MIFKISLKLNQSIRYITQQHLFCSLPSNTQRLNNVTFFGNDKFSLAILNGLHALVKKNFIKNLNVITCDNSKQQHSGIKSIKKNHVIDYCKENKIDYFIWEKIKEDKNVLVDHDLAVVASFGYLIPSRIINLYKQ